MHSSASAPSARHGPPADAYAAARACAEHGARLLSWTVGEHPVIHWPADANWSAVAKVRGGNPVLFPFIARHMLDGVQGKWKDEAGKVYDLPVHGFARESRFEVDSAATAAGYPFSFQFDVVYRLASEAELEVSFEASNTGSQPMPYYAGHHFYFAVKSAERGNWTLQLPFDHSGRQNADGSVSFGALAEKDRRTTFADPAINDRYHLNDPKSAKEGLVEGAKVTFENAALKRRIIVANGPIAGSPLRHTAPWYAVTTWTEKPESDFYCVEPWLGLPNAIHHGHGLRRLAPGASEAAVCHIRFEAL
eukprot:tig00020601_g11717.t1